ncbi:MAG TPA: IS3 family transposase [Pantanalinema sp.]
MKSSRFTEEQIIRAIKEVDAGRKVADVCRELGVTDQTMYNWRRKYGGMEVSQAKQLKQLEDENRRLKLLLADATLDNQALKAALGKKLVKPAAKRRLVRYWVDNFQLSERRACGLANLAKSVWQYKSKKAVSDAPLKEQLLELARERPRFGYRRLWAMLRRQGEVVNRKRVYRVYRELGLAVRRRKRKKIAAAARVRMPAPSRSNQRWSMDFVSDGLRDGRRFRTLNIVDDYTRECLAIEVDFSLPGARVVCVLNELAATRGLPEAITIDNGPEFAGKALDEWAYEKGVSLQFIRPGKPVENAYIESFNGKFRDECLNTHVFKNMLHARALISAWRDDYNQVRPHSALGLLSPQEFNRGTARTA